MQNGLSLTSFQVPVMFLSSSVTHLLIKEFFYTKKDKNMYKLSDKRKTEAAEMRFLRIWQDIHFGTQKEVATWEQLGNFNVNAK